jgi:O-antigen/teichoic acid export membrane protein
LGEQQSSYRQVIRGTSIFGGVQVLNIIITIIRSKFVATLLGPTGIGISGLLTSAIGLISGLTSFGLGTSGVKDIAAANSTGNETRISRIVIVLQRLIWITGILGALSTLLLSSWLSKITFGNYDYTIAFVWISFTVLFNQLSSGQLVILQGLRKLKFLAKANLYGSLLGLIVTIPIYYKFGLDGIVPSIIITSVISLLFSWYFVHKLKIKVVRVTRIRTIAEGKSMFVMGFVISLSGLITLVGSYIIRIFLNHYGGVAQVGLYTAGFAIINTYAGLIFNAMGTDYYPRLAAVVHDREVCNNTINQQAEVAILLLGPVLIIFLLIVKWVIILLYSNKFLDINDMLYWASIGMFFRAVSWSIAFVFIAKGDAKMFIGVELLINFLMLVINFVGYSFWGLSGLGIAFLLTYVFYLLQVLYISRKRYMFQFSSSLKKIFLIQLFLSTSCFASIRIVNEPMNYILGILLFLISSFFSFRELNFKIDIKTLVFDNFKNKSDSQ